MVKKEITFLLAIGVLFSGLFFSINNRHALLKDEQKSIDIYSIIKENASNFNKFEHDKILTKNTLIICWSSIYINNVLLFKSLNINEEKYRDYYIVAISPFENEDYLPQSKLDIVFVFNEPRLISEFKKIPSNESSLEIPFFIELERGKIINTKSY